MSSTSQNVQLFIDAWKLLVGRLPEGTIRHEGHVATMFGNISLPFLNLSLHDCPLPDRQALRRVLTTALERATSYPYPWMFGLSEDWAPLGWEEVAADLGLSCVDRLTGMAAAALKPPRRPLPAMEYRRVQTDATARDLSDVNREAYGMPQELFEGICNLHLWKPDSHGYVAYEAGRAISAAAAFPVAGTVYVALVATLPGQQGKGYAEAVMRHCIGEAQKAMGVIRTSLHATEIGIPLYRALGYESLSRIFLLVQSGH